VVEVEVVREPMHQDDRRALPRVVPDVDPMLVPLYESLLVVHHSLGKDCQRTSGRSGRLRREGTLSCEVPSATSFGVSRRRFRLYASSSPRALWKSFTIRWPSSPG